MNSYDIVPRLFSFLHWIDEAIPKSDVLAKQYGPFKIRLAVEAYLRKAVKDKAVRKAMGAYDTVGTLVFITQGSRFTQRVPTDIAKRSHRQTLGKLPDEIGPFIFDQHHMAAYSSIVAGLHVVPAAAETTQLNRDEL